MISEISRVQLLLCAVAAAAAAPPARAPASSISEGGAPVPLTHGGSPVGVSLETDCAIRQLAYEYGRKIQPSRGAFKTLHDALQLGACGVPLEEQDAHTGNANMGEWRAAAQPPTPHAAIELVVEPVRGDDDAALAAVVSRAAGPAAPFATIAAAVSASTAARSSSSQPVHIMLRGGTHFVAETIELTDAHSHLTIRNADGETAVVSGGVNLTAAWATSKQCAGCFEMDLKAAGVRQILGLRRNGVREIRARYPNFDPELDSTIEGKRHFHDGQVSPRVPNSTYEPGFFVQPYALVWPDFEFRGTHRMAGSLARPTGSQAPPGR